MDPYSAVVTPFKARAAPRLEAALIPLLLLLGRGSVYSTQVTPAWCPQLQEEPRKGQVKPISLLLQAKPPGRGAPDQKKLHSHKRQGSAITSAELCFQQQPCEKENLLCRPTIGDPKDKLQSLFGEGPNTSCNTPISYWIPFCFLVCQSGRSPPPTSCLTSGRAGKDRANKAESTSSIHPQSTLEKRGISR